MERRRGCWSCNGASRSVACAVLKHRRGRRGRLNFAVNAMERRRSCNGALPESSGCNEASRRVAGAALKCRRGCRGCNGAPPRPELHSWSFTGRHRCCVEASPGRQGCNVASLGCHSSFAGAGATGRQADALTGATREHALGAVAEALRKE